MKLLLSTILLVLCFQSQSVTGFTQGNLLVLKVGALDGSSAIEGDPSSEDFLTVSYLEEIDINTNIIDYKTSKIRRKEYINNFKNNENNQILLNVQILNEGIDIPECDSIFINTCL
jgi:hypothetical protein